MYLTHLSLTNFRNFSRLDMAMPRGVMLLVGDNAQGKTSILEAIYYLSTFTSFQAGQQRELINFIAARQDVAVGRIIAEYVRGDRTHRLEVRIIQEPNGVNGSRFRREVLLDNTKQKLGEAIGHFNAVLFLPRMMSTIDGAPSERRHYLNLALAQTNPHYTANLSAYEKALSQRNALLKLLAERGGDPDQLHYWDEEIVRSGAYIIKARIAALKEIEDLAALVHHELTRGTERLRLIYRPSFDPYIPPTNQMALPMGTSIDRSGFSKEDIQSAYQDALIAARSTEIGRGMTTLGPHRDDVQFLANGMDLGIYGSRGQVRTTLLALKIAEISWMQAKTGHWPVLLLDEVLAELDPQRRADLLQQTTKIEQALLTTTDLDLFSPDFAQSAAIWRVAEGRLTTS